MRKRTSEIFDFLNIQNDKTFCYLDIDDFSKYNETHGFEMGNQILESLVTIFKSFPFIEELLKISGDEYILRCKGNFEENKSSLFELLQFVSEKLDITFSVGVSDFNFSTPELLLKVLRKNVLEAKSFGKNKIYYAQ